MRCGLGLGLARGRSRGGGGDPLLAAIQAMFGSGEQGVIQDLTDPTSMFQERTGALATTPSGNNGPIGSLKDLSPNNNWAVAPSDAGRALSRQGVAAPNSYGEWDGVDDSLQALFVAAQPITRISCFLLNSGSTGKRVFGSPATENLALFQQAGDNFYAMYALTVLPIGDSILGTPVVITEQYNGASSRGRINGGAYVNGNAGAGGVTGLRIGVDSTGTVFAAMRVYRSVQIARLLTDVEIAQVVTWCAEAGAL